MGTRYEDQPPELWAGPESLDPTPVWKQFVLVGAFLAIGLALVGVVAALAVAPQIVTPPALVAGERLVLPVSAVRAVGAPANDIGPPLVDARHAFWLSRLSPTEIVAFRARWSPKAGEPECPVQIGLSGAALGYIASCEASSGRLFVFDARGESHDAGWRSLDRYLVSVSEDRVIVNLSRLIVAPERTSAPLSP